MFNAATYIHDTCHQVQVTTKGTVLVAVSGGVDSLTSALLLRHANVSVRLVYVDTGFQRIGELEEVQSIYAELGMQLDVLDASSAFIANTKQAATPYEKREAFRKVYYEALIEYMDTHRLQCMVQGTQSHTTTTQVGHNAPHAYFADKQYTMIEPVMGLTKDQVRLVARSLGATPAMFQRMPFPGPGLLIRVSGAPTSEKLQVIRHATKIIDDAIAATPELRQKGYQIFPYFTDDISLPYRSEQGMTQFGGAIFIRSLQAIHAAGRTHYVPLRFPASTETDVIAELMALPGVARVLFDLTPKVSEGLRTLTPTGIEFS